MEPRSDWRNYQTQDYVDPQKKERPRYSAREDDREIRWVNQNQHSHEDKHRDPIYRFPATKEIRSATRTDDLEDTFYSARRTYKELRSDKGNYQTHDSLHLQKKERSRYSAREDDREIGWENSDEYTHEDMNKDSREGLPT